MNTLADKVVLGTVSWGMPYGLPGASVPTDGDLQTLVKRADALGIFTYDTALGYGDAAKRLVQVTGSDHHLWSKIGDAEVPVDAAALQQDIRRTLHTFANRQVRYVQWHNATALHLQDENFCKVLADRHAWQWGASAYGVTDAQALAQHQSIDVVQVAWNILDQFPLAELQHAHTAVRSVYLKGVLTDRGGQLPLELEGLTAARQALVQLAQDWDMALAELALWSALHCSGADYILLGVSHADELSVVERVLSMPAPSPEQMALVQQQALTDRRLLDPRAWPEFSDRMRHAG